MSTKHYRCHVDQAKRAGMSTKHYRWYVDQTLPLSCRPSITAVMSTKHYRCHVERSETP